MMVWAKVKMAALVVGVTLSALAICTAAVAAVGPATAQAATKPAWVAAVPIVAELIPQTDQAVQAVVDRFDALKNLSATYSSEAFHPPHPNDARNRPVDIGRGMMLIPIIGKQDAKETFSRLGPKVRWDTDPVLPENAGEIPNSKLRMNPILQSIVSYTGDSQERLDVTDSHGPAGTIVTAPRFPEALLDAALGLRANEANAFFSTDEIRQMRFEKATDGTILMNWRDPKERIQQWVFKPELGYAVAAFRVMLPKLNNFVTHEVIAQDFEAVDGLMLPRTVIRRVWGSGPRLIVETQLQVHDYKLNDPENTESRYHITWPKGTDVLDMRVGKNFVADEKGALIRNR